MYTAPTALMSLVVLLPILAGLAALYYSHLNMTLIQQVDQERDRAARLAVEAVKGELMHNATLLERASQGNLTQQDLEYMSGLATRILRSELGVPYTVSVYVEVVKTNITMGSAGFVPSYDIVYSQAYQPRGQAAHWSYEVVRAGRGVYVVVGCGV